MIAATVEPVGRYPFMPTFQTKLHFVSAVIVAFITFDSSAWSQQAPTAPAAGTLTPREREPAANSTSQAPPVVDVPPVPATPPIVQVAPARKEPEPVTPEPSEDTGTASDAKAVVTGAPTVSAREGKAPADSPASAIGSGTDRESADLPQRETASPSPLRTETPPANASAEAAGTTSTDPAPVSDANGNSPWVILAAFALGAGTAALLLRRRLRGRKRSDISGIAIPPKPSRPLKEAMDQRELANAAPGIAHAGRPWVDVSVRVTRTGMIEEGLEVEFILGLENNGSMPAEDVWISSFIVPPDAFEEQQLQGAGARSGQARLPVPIEPGETKRVASSAVLARDSFRELISPVLVISAEYALPGGTNAVTTAAFEVGAAKGCQLGPFDVENPAGLHAEVKVTPHGEVQRT